MLLKIILTVLIVVVIAGVLVIGLIASLVIVAAGAAIIEHKRINKETSHRPPRLSAWRKRSIEEKE